MGKFSNNKYLRSNAGNLFSLIGNTATNYSLSFWKKTFGWDEGSTMIEVIDQSVKLEFINLFIAKTAKAATSVSDPTIILSKPGTNIQSLNSILRYQTKSQK